ncbi:MAG: tetratricopeptide repeat protein [Minisyncoccia bacterium]
MFLLFVYLFLVSVLFGSKQRIFNSYIIFLLSSLVFSLFLILRIVFGADFLSFGIFNSIVSTMIGSWNNVGIFFGVCAILSLVTFEIAPISYFMKYVLGATLLVSLFFLALVNFKLLWFILAICSLAFTVYVFISNKHRPHTQTKILRMIPISSVIFFLISVVFIIWGMDFGGLLSSKLQVENLEIRPSFSATYDVVKNTLNTNPFFGSGPNTFINGWSKWKPNDILSTIYWNLEFSSGFGLIPTYIVTAGIVGILSWFVFIAYLIYLGFKTIFNRNQDDLSKYLSVSSFFLSIYLWAVAFIYVPSTAIIILTFFFTGLFLASLNISNVSKIRTIEFSSHQKTAFFISFILTLTFIFLATIGWCLLNNARSSWYFQKSLYSLNSEKNTSLSEKYIIVAINLAPLDVYYRELVKIELAKLNEIISQETSNETQEALQVSFAEILKKAIYAGTKAKEKNPLNYLNWISLGNVYGSVSNPNLKIKGAYNNTEFSYKEALKLNPKNPSILVLLSRLAASNNELSRAREYAMEAISLKYNYLDAYFVLSQIEVAAGNIKDAIDTVTSTTMIDPNNPAVFFQLGLLKYNQSDWNGAIEAFQKALKITDNYANAKYFLGLSYEIIGQHDKAIAEFKELKLTNPDSQEVETILSNLLANKPIFTNTDKNKPEKGNSLPIIER